MLDNVMLYKHNLFVCTTRLLYISQHDLRLEVRKKHASNGERTRALGYTHALNLACAIALASAPLEQHLNWVQPDRNSRDHRRLPGHTLATLPAARARTGKQKGPVRHLSQLKPMGSPRLQERRRRRPPPTQQMPQAGRAARRQAPTLPPRRCSPCRTRSSWR